MLALLALAASASCSRSSSTSPNATGTVSMHAGETPTAPEARSVLIETTSCGHADSATGSGVIVDDGLVATVAHVVIAASTIDVTFSDGSHHDGRIVALDTTRDLAVIAVDGATATPVVSGTGSKADTGLLVGGARSGTTPFTVVRKVVLEIEEVRGTDRHKRQGFELDALTGTGDSGAGIYNNDEQLIGIVFATSTSDATTTWATDTAELTTLLDSIDHNASYACDPNQSKVDQ